MSNSAGEAVRSEMTATLATLEPPITTSTPRTPVLAHSTALNREWALDDLLDRMNASLHEGDRISVRFESAGQRRLRKYGRIRPDFVRRALINVDFVIHNVFAKLQWTRPVYAFITRRRYRVMSVNEVLGRIVAAGFSIERTRAKSGLHIVEAEKIGAPDREKEPTFGLFVGLNRVGYKGRLITVYKLRTMSPYSEFLQSYMHRQNGLSSSGKFASDTRITSWGHVLRRFWIDELPMLWNLVRRELKIVGVRPISRHYLSLYPEDVREQRIQFRPGLIPPFYADLPKTFDEIVASEVRYMEAYRRRPFRTDLRYGMRAFRNIFFRGARSG